ncbi:MAG: hypothetical protein PHY48_16040, partial [Candidatus Cloacimonetes bacterium]|nr:hypothetical protein [Candidatus Cloacimonadota bacterium]
MKNYMKYCLHWIDFVYRLITSEIKATDIRGNESTSLQLLNREQKLVIGLALTPWSPSSTLTNATIILAGLQAKTISSTGVVTTNWYDSLGRSIMSGNLSTDVLGANPATIVQLETVVAASGSRNTFTLMGYNDKGQVAWTRDSASNTTWFAYNDYGQRYAVIRAVN